MSSNELCPICQEGYLTEHKETNTVQYRGVSLELPLLYSVCDGGCGSDQTSSLQAAVNKKKSVEAKQKIDEFIELQARGAL